MESGSDATLPEAARCHCGVTPTGMSRIRLIWGADPHTSMTIYRGQRRFKYFAGETVAVQRFFLEQLHEPAEYKPDWDKGVTNGATQGA